MNIESGKREVILEKIGAPPSRESLLSLISWLDKECIATEDLTSIPYQILVRSIIAIGYKLIDERGERENILNTVRSGENYALNPTEENRDVFIECGTMSYPLGPGEGCFGIEELGDGSSCKPGNGCISGAGSFALQGLDDGDVIAIIAKELTPWILGNDDPIISRIKT
jgi:hypothetical protein